mgnify:CR=1 FL=1
MILSRLKKNECIVWINFNDRTAIKKTAFQVNVRLSIGIKYAVRDMSTDLVKISV